MDQIDTLKLFVRLSQTLSFSQTAEDFGLPRATVSNAIAQLEARLGVRLLHRTTRKVQLSQDGLVLLSRCDALLSEFDEIHRLFKTEQDSVAGRLRVDVPSRIARRVIAPALPAFLNQYPQIELELGSTDRKVDLVQEGIDCAVRVGHLDDSSLVARSFGVLPVINCASPDYLDCYGTPLHPDQLAEHWMIRYAVGSGRVLPWDYVNEQGLTQLANIKGRVTVNNAETYIACALEGLGLIQVPHYDVAHHLASGALVQVLPQYRAEALPIHLLYPHRRHLSPRVQVFMDWMNSLMRGFVADSV